MRAWRNGEFRFVLSEFLLEEIAVSTRSRLRTCSLASSAVDRFVLELRAFCDVVEPADLDFEYPRDPDDVPVLAALIASGADLLVTGDGDLLALREQYPIETPAEFVRRL